MLRVQDPINSIAQSVKSITFDERIKVDSVGTIHVRPHILHTGFRHSKTLRDKMARNFRALK